MFLSTPFALFQKMLISGDLAKIAITWPLENLWSRFSAPKSSPVFARYVHSNKRIMAFASVHLGLSNEGYFLGNI